MPQLLGANPARAPAGGPGGGRTTGRGTEGGGTEKPLAWLNSRLVTYTAAIAISKLGNQLYNFALPWIVLQSTGSPLAAGLMWAVQTLSYLATPLIGWVVDRFNRKHVYVFCELMQAALVATVPFIALGEHPAPWALYPVSFILGLCGATSGLIGDFKVMPSLVDKRFLSQANATYAFSVNIARVSGPAAAGLIIATAGIHWAFFLDALSFLGSAIVVGRLALGQQAQSRSGQGFMSGFGFLSRHRALWRLALGLGVYNLGVGAIPVTLLYVLKSERGMGAGVVGLILSLGSAGAVLGSLLGGMIPVRNLMRAVSRANFVGAAMTATTLLGPLAAAGCGYAGLLVCESAVNVWTFTLRQRLIPDELLGRVNAAFRMVVMGTAPLSATLMGAIAGSPAEVGARSAWERRWCSRRR